MIRWNNVSFQKNSRYLLQDISVELPAGQLTVVLGPNGAGKSTFLRLCSKEMLPTSGHIDLHDRNLQSWSTEELALFRGVLSQSLPMTFPMQVTELVLMGRYPHKTRRALDERDHEIVQHALADCNVQHLTQRSTQFLSGGEMQRTQTARVLAQIWEQHAEHPRVLLLDEPTASLDPAYQHLCLMKARQLADQGVCVVAILHDLNLAARYADHIVFLKEGRLAGAGPMREMMREAMLEKVFSVDIRTVHDPRLEHPLIVTLGPQYQPIAREPKLRSL
ncbi:heme ABC transporter ATP-binding protein [Oligoflexus tunisiensis]|uniref:heme ABC transporter ATP-binding protein n=1 Tax=Oligoflexus tunisiensis TaxID=708132 RepID=UPI00114CE248|nr:heme ABC transporter ATP-binding protein [Oligoflexus tunisiensis]